MDRKEAQAILNKVKDLIATEFPGYTAQFGKTKFDTRGEIDLSFSMIAKSAQEEIAQRDTNIGLAKNKLHPSIIGMEFISDGKTYTVESVRTRKQKYPVICRRDDGKAFRFATTLINEKAEEEFGTKVRYVGNMAILDGRD